MNTFYGKINKAAEDKQSMVCVGLSPDWEMIPDVLKEKFKSSGAVLFIFNKAVIDAVADIVPAICLDFAKYMRYGIGGMVSFKSTVDYAKKKGLIVITECNISGKGGYIAEAFLKTPTEDLPDQLRDGAFDTDGITVSLYGENGSEEADEFYREISEKADGDKGIFVLYKDGCIGNSELLRKIKDMNAEASAKSSVPVGIFVQSDEHRTHRMIRNELPESIILSENVSCARDVFKNDGQGALIISRENIMYAYRNSKWADKYGEEGFAEASRKEAYDIIGKINEAAGF